MPLDDIEFLSPPGAIKPTGPWSLGLRGGDFVFVAGAGITLLNPWNA